MIIKLEKHELQKLMQLGLQGFFALPRDIVSISHGYGAATTEIEAHETPKFDEFSPMAPPDPLPGDEFTS